MEVTKELLKELYDEYNQRYFDGILGPCKFHLFSKNITFLGAYHSHEDNNGRPKDAIWIGTSVYWNEELLRIVLVHEMVHKYVYRVEGCKHDGILGHGRRFRRQAKRLRKEFGLDIFDVSGAEFINPKQRPKRWERMLLWLIDR